MITIPDKESQELWNEVTEHQDSQNACVDVANEEDDDDDDDYYDYDDDDDD